LISNSGKTHVGRHLIPRPAFKGAPGSFLLDTAPLLEKEWDPRPQALIADFGHPARLEWTRAITYPSNAIIIEQLDKYF
jgi:hypothetical protein